MEKVIKVLEIASLIFMSVVVAAMLFASLTFILSTFPLSMAFATLLAISLGLGWWIVND